MNTSDASVNPRLQSAAATAREISGQETGYLFRSAYAAALEFHVEDLTREVCRLAEKLAGLEELEQGRERQ